MPLSAAARASAGVSQNWATELGETFAPEISSQPSIRLPWLLTMPSTRSTNFT